MGMVGGMCTQEEQIYFTDLVPNLVLLKGSKWGLRVCVKEQLTGAQALGFPSEIYKLFSVCWDAKRLYLFDEMFCSLILKVLHAYLRVKLCGQTFEGKSKTKQTQRNTNTSFLMVMSTS